ncbi:MAG: arylsulfatase [Adhaeribacter sp.]
MKRISLLLLVLLGGLGVQARSKPNIIYILADDLGYGDLSCYGQKNFRTPVLDQLAATGIRFTQHYAGSPVCAPSRAALMTGRDPGHGRVRGNYESGPQGFGAGYPLEDQDVTVAEALKMAGYRTALIGKWGLGMTGTSGAPEKQGFDYMYGFLNQAHAHHQFPDYLHRNGKKESLPENAGGRRGRYSNDIFTTEALAYLATQKKDQPFFLYLAYVTPHAELIVPEDSLFHRLKGRFPEKPFVGGKQGSNGKDPLGAYASQAYPAAAYAAMVVRLDRDIGKVMAQLKKMGLADNTLLMFSSDNGSHKEGGADPRHHQSNGKLRGAKRDVYEGGIRVPFIAHWPAGIRQGRVSDHLSAFWDLLPTVAELAELDLRKAGIPTEGRSFAPTLLGKLKAQQQHPYLYWEFHENKFSDQALRLGRWKGVRHDPAGKMELYDLQADLAETKDVAAANPRVVQQIEQLLAKARVPHPRWHLKSADTAGRN